MRVLRPSISGLIIAFGLAGCMSAPASSPTAGPGSAIVPPSQAAVFFNAACLGTAPSFANAGTALSSYGFTQNTRTGTFYNNAGNLSIKARPGQCSIVMGLNKAPDQALLEFGTALNTLAADNDATVEIDLTNAPDGITYLIARTAG